MKEKYLEVLNEMLNDEEVKGKRRIEDLIWLNTVKPKFNVRDKVRFSSRGAYICDVPIHDFHGVITEIRKFPMDKLIQYKIWFKYIGKSGVVKETDAVSVEEDMHISNYDGEFINDVRCKA